MDGMSGTAGSGAMVSSISAISGIVEAPTTRRGGLLFATCPYCHKKHVHGPGTPNMPWRAADCGKGSYQLRMKGRSRK
jgi:hypothetical protein